MKIEKQQKLDRILKSGAYEIDFENGLIYSIRKRGKNLLIGGLLPTGYKQLLMYNKKRKQGDTGIFYYHQIIYFAKYGFYPEGMEIDHIDRDNTNNSITNLKLVSTKENAANKAKMIYPATLKLIRSDEIKSIRSLHAIGQSQQSIAKELNLNRLSVRYIIKQGNYISINPFGLKN
jgi:hypothetical protein